MLINVLT